MITSIHVLNRSRMTDLKAWIDATPSVIAISITDPEEPPIWHKARKNVLPLAFHDVDRIGGGMVTFTAHMAKQVHDFICRHHQDADPKALYVNCEAGCSRSGAVAEYARRYIGMNYEQFKRANPGILPNTFVLAMLSQHKRDK